MALIRAETIIELACSASRIGPEWLGLSFLAGRYRLRPARGGITSQLNDCLRPVDAEWIENSNSLPTLNTAAHDLVLVVVLGGHPLLLAHVGAWGSSFVESWIDCFYARRGRLGTCVAVANWRFFACR